MTPTLPATIIYIYIYSNPSQPPYSLLLIPALVAWSRRSWFLVLAESCFTMRSTLIRLAMFDWPSLSLLRTLIHTNEVVVMLCSPLYSLPWPHTFISCSSQSILWKCRSILIIVAQILCNDGKISFSYMSVGLIAVCTTRPQVWWEFSCHKALYLIQAFSILYAISLPHPSSWSIVVPRYLKIDTLFHNLWIEIINDHRDCWWKLTNWYDSNCFNSVVSANLRVGSHVLVKVAVSMYDHLPSFLQVLWYWFVS